MSYSRDGIYLILGSILSVILLSLFFIITGKGPIDLIAAFMHANSFLDYFSNAYDLKKEFGVALLRILWCYIILTGADLFFYTSSSAGLAMQIASKTFLVVIAETITEAVITQTTAVWFLFGFIGFSFIFRKVSVWAFFQTFLSAALFALIVSATQTNAVDIFMSLLTIMVTLIGLVYLIRVVTR